MSSAVADRAPVSGSARPLSLLGGLALTAWLGLVTGYGELAYKAFRKFGRGLFLFQGDNAPWLTPLSTALLFMLLALLGYGSLRLCRRQPTAGVILGAGTALGLMSLLFLVPVIHKFASVVLALGVGIQLARSGLAEKAWFTRVRGKSLPLLILAVAATAVVLPLRRALEERQARAAMPPAPSGAPNVLLIILDTVRSLNLSAYGYGKPTTPMLERRARAGARFARALSPAPWTLPSHATMFTGRETFELGTDWYTPLDDSTPTLAEVLRDRGWRTGGFVANLPYTSREVGLARGFVHYEDQPLTLATLASAGALVRTITTNRPLRDALGWHRPFVAKTAPAVTASFLRWVDQQPGRPFFGFLNYYDAHRPYFPPEPYRRRFLPPGIDLQPEARRRPANAPPWTRAELVGSVASYDGAIAYLDDQLELLFRALEQRGLLDNTIVILTSDHGEEFAEHGMIDHGNSLYRASLEIPLFLWWPGRVPAGMVAETPVTTRDIPATIMALLALPGPHPFPGRSLSRVWTPGADTAVEPIYAEVRRAPRLPGWYPASRGDMLGVLESGLRYIRNGDSVLEVFDFERDSSEARNLAGADTLSPQLAPIRVRLDSIHRGSQP